MTIAQKALAAVFAMFAMMAACSVGQGSVDEEVVGRYWDYNGSITLEIGSDATYRIYGGGLREREGAVTTDDGQLNIDGKRCRYRHFAGSPRDSLTINCDDGGPISRVWERQPAGR